MRMNKFWIVRKGEDARKVAPEVADAIANHPDSNPQCLCCGRDHLRAAVMAWREQDFIMTAGVCVYCAQPSSKPRKFSGWATSHFSPGI